MDHAQRAVESILENEALTEGLDDKAADVLLDWATTLARQAASDTAGMTEEHAEGVLAPRMRNVRQFVRQVNRWAVGASLEELPALSRTLELAAPIYGEGVRQIDPQKLQGTFQGRGQMGSPAERIARLRQSIEELH